MSALAARLRGVDVDQVAARLRAVARYATAAAKVIEYARQEFDNATRFSGTSTRPTEPPERMRSDVLRTR